MLFRRFIPKIVVQWDESRNSFTSILTRNYEFSRKVGDPVNQVQVMQSNLVDEIVLINRTEYFDPRFTDLVHKIATRISTPLSVGGAISNAEHCHSLIEAGADKLIIGRMRRSHTLSGYVSRVFGAQSLVMSLDYVEAQQSVDELLVETIASLELGHFGEIILNSVSRDGYKNGPDLKTLRVVVGSVKIPVVLGCGFSRVEHFHEAFLAGASAVTSSTFLSNMDQSPKQIRAHLHSLGTHIRVRN